MGEDNERAQVAPSSGDPRTQGAFSMRASTEIRCQVRRPDGICNQLLARVAGQDEPTGRTVAHLALIPDGHDGAWCPRCKRASVYARVA